MDLNLQDIVRKRICKNTLDRAAIENVNTIDDKIVRSRVFACHLSPVLNTVSSHFDPRSSIVKSVFDFHLSDVKKG